MAGPKFDITDEQIDVLVTAFYARARKDATLGPIFLNAIGTSNSAWQTHEAHISSFWRNALGIDRSFTGNPMLKHLANHQIEPEHFPIWLEIFNQTAKDVLPQPAAEGISALANRIGQSLSWGLTQFRNPDVPKLG
ncbi:group III truncated hemoglobin [Rhodobacteraceae bacterium]|nr:group III truncated hemoglobin [Paracoccaceae bacterium]